MENITQGQWFGTSGADLGDPIDQSILFDGVYGAEYLTRTMGAGDSRRKFTVSTWVKRIDFNTANHNTFWMYHSNPNVVGLEFKGHHLRFYHYDSSGTFNAEYISNATFRDPTAWYHVVAAVDTTQSTSTDRIKLWVNGVRVTSFSTQNTFSLNYDTHVGVNGNTNLIGIYADLSSNQYKGYIAQTIFLDGICYDASYFGKYNDSNVWIPQTYSGSYGTNGYRLLYEQGNGNTIGTDSSTNSNDFTKSTAVSTLADGTSWSGLAPNWTTANYGAHPRAIFDSKYATSSSFYYGGPGTAYLDNLGAALGTGVTEIKITHYPRLGTNTFTINGTSTSASGNSDQEMTVTHDGSAITSMSFAGNDVAHYGVGGIKVNGMVLTDQRRVNCLDTPTNNQTIVSPIDNGNRAQLDFNFGGLAISGKTTQYQVTRATFAVDSGKWYWECRLTNTDKGTYYPSQGIANVDTMDLEANSQAGGANFADSPQYMANGQKYIATVLSGFGASFDLGDVIGMALDMDAGTLTCYKNGASQGVLTSGLSGTFTMCANNYAASTAVSAYAETDYNFSGPFVYTPPTGHSALAVSNDTEPTIKNGKDHCGVVLYSGDASSGRDISGLNFQPDFVWLKGRNIAYNHRLYDSLRGVNKSLITNVSDGQYTHTNALTAFNSDGFELGTETSYNDSGNSYVGWCWKAGGAPTATNSNAAGAAQTAGSVKVNGSDGSFAQGSIAVKKMSVNTEAGFSIVEYQGTGSAGTIPHGLGAVPEFAIFKRHDGTSAWEIYHKDVGNTQTLQFSTAGKSSANAAYFNNTSPTSTLFSLGAGGVNNTNGEQVIAYIWSSVKGYSKAGEYYGSTNSSSHTDEGDFVYCGFKPQFVIIKNTVSADWIIIDDVRNDFNPRYNIIYPNTSSSESTMTTTAAVDFTANGFKIRQGGSFIGDDSYPYVYMAFASNPFGGENTAFNPAG